MYNYGLLEVYLSNGPLNTSTVHYVSLGSSWSTLCHMNMFSTFVQHQNENPNVAGNF